MIDDTIFLFDSYLASLHGNEVILKKLSTLFLVLSFSLDFRRHVSPFVVLHLHGNKFPSSFVNVPLIITLLINLIGF